MGSTPQLQPIGTFAGPVYVAAPLHENHLLFVVERAGQIRVIQDGVVRPQPFLDISVDNSGPVVNLTSPAGGNAYDSVIAAWKADASHQRLPGVTIGLFGALADETERRLRQPFDHFAVFG